MAGSKRSRGVASGGSKSTAEHVVNEAELNSVTLKVNKQAARNSKGKSLVRRN